MPNIAIFTELEHDSITAALVSDMRGILHGLRWFSAHPYESIMKHSRQYAAWHKTILKTSKAFARWIIPIWHNSTIRIVSADVYGKHTAPVDGLQHHSVSRLIRYLLFDKKWEQEVVVHYLVWELNYQETSARPLVRRMLRKEEKYSTLWEREKSETDATAVFTAFLLKED